MQRNSDRGTFQPTPLATIAAHTSQVQVNISEKIDPGQTSGSERWVGGTRGRYFVHVD